MVSFKTTFDNVVTSSVPKDVDQDILVKIFHDHKFLIHMQPIVTRHEMRERDPATGKLTYDVWENIDLLPFGLWKYELQFTTAFTDTKDGTISWTEAPGFVSEATYTVKPGEALNGEGGEWVLEERIETTCPFLLRWFVEGTMVSVRQKMHQNIFDDVRKREREERNSAESAASGESRPVQRPPGNFF